MIDEANQSLEEAGTPSHEVSVVILHREFVGGSLGITLAGGADYETKEITVSHFEDVFSGIQELYIYYAEQINNTKCIFYETQVHKVITGSIADRDARVHRGDRILSINGKNTKGLTHREALNLLKVSFNESYRT